MTPTKIIDFIIKHDGRITDVRPIYQSYAYFQKLIDNNLVIRLRKKKRTIGFLTYYLVENYKDCLKTDEEWILPKNYTKGDKAFIDTCVVRPNFRCEKTTLEFRKKMMKKEPNIKEIAWFDIKNRLRIYPFNKR